MGIDETKERFTSANGFTHLPAEFRGHTVDRCADLHEPCVDHGLTRDGKNQRHDQPPDGDHDERDRDRPAHQRTEPNLGWSVVPAGGRQAARGGAAPAVVARAPESSAPACPFAGAGALVPRALAANCGWVVRWGRWGASLWSDVGKSVRAWCMSPPHSAQPGDPVSYLARWESYLQRRLPVRKTQAAAFVKMAYTGKRLPAFLQPQSLSSFPSAAPTASSCLVAVCAGSGGLAQR